MTPLHMHGGMKEHPLFDYSMLALATHEGRREGGREGGREGAYMYCPTEVVSGYGDIL